MTTRSIIVQTDDDDIEIVRMDIVLPHNVPIVDRSVDVDGVRASLNDHARPTREAQDSIATPCEGWHWTAAHKLRAFMSKCARVPDDADLTLADIMVDVVTHPQREVKAFLSSLFAMSDNVDALFCGSRVDLFDPETRSYRKPVSILTRVLVRQLKKTFTLPRHKVVSLLIAALNTPAAFRGSAPSCAAVLGSLYNFFHSPGKPDLFSVRAAACANLESLFTVRQFLRFVIIASVIALACKAGGAIWRQIRGLFGLNVELHSLRLDGWVSLVTAILITWVTGVFTPRVVTEFLRASSFTGASGPIMKSLTDAASAVLKLVADFFSWVGMKAVSDSMTGWLNKSTIEDFTRRGGRYNELVPRINSFLSARSIGSTGPGTRAYVEEGRTLVRCLDVLIRDALAIEGAGMLIASMQRTRLQVVSAVENSLFSVEMSIERTEPVSVIFVGGPRMGKTMLMNVVIEALRQRCASFEEKIGIDRHVSQNAREGRWVYSRNTSDEFYSGYNRQCVILFDDLFTGNNAKQSDLAAQRHERELSELQALVSSQPYAPPMPEVGAGVPCPKGTYIAPAWVCATSNFLFPNTGARSSEIIDDRLNLVVLAVERKGVPKDATFSHLDLYLSNIVLSELRKKQDAHGVVAPYSAYKHIPYTTEEFVNWPLARYFRKITIHQLIDEMVAYHTRRVGETMVRRAAVMRITETSSNLSKLTASLLKWCAENHLTPPNDPDALLAGVGITRTLQEVRLGDNKLAIANPLTAQFIVSLVAGELQHGEVDTPVKCTCVGGHSTITDCEHFSELRGTYYLKVRDDISPETTINYFVQDETLVCLRPAKEKPFEKITRDLGVPIAHLGTHVDCRPVGENFVGVSLFAQLGVVRSVAVCQRNGLCFTTREDGELVRVPRKSCYPIPQIDLHTLSIDHDEVVNIVFDKPLHHEEGDPIADEVVDTLTQCLREGVAISELSLVKIVDVLANGRLVSTHVIPDIRFTHASFLTGDRIQRVVNREPNTQWLNLMFDRLRTLDQHANLFLERLKMRHWWYLEQMTKISDDYDQFEVRALAFLVIQSQLDWRVTSVFSWYFMADNGAHSPLPHPSFPFVVIQYTGIEEGLIRHDLRTGPLMLEKVVNRIPFMTELEINEELPILLRFVNRCAMLETSLLDRVKACLNWAFNAFTKYWKEITGVCLAMAGIFLALDIGALISSLVRAPELHAAQQHHPRLAKNPFGRKFDRLYQSVIHEGSPYKCALCQSLANVDKVSNWDEEKQIKILEACADDVQFLRGLYDANVLFADALKSDTLDECIEKMEKMVYERKVPRTGGGVSRHLYVAISFSCQNARQKALACIAKQQSWIVARLGKKFDTIEPSLRMSVNIRSCDIPSRKLKYCTFDGQCSCVELDARYLPDDDFTVTGVERCVAEAASTIGSIMVGSTLVGRGCAVADGVLIAPSHVLEEIGDAPVRVDWVGQTKWHDFVTSADVHIVGKTDIAILKCHSTELPTKRFSELVMRTPPQVGSKVSLVLRGINGGFERHDRTIVGKPKALLNFDVSNILYIDRGLKKGDSGALVIQGSKIVGHYTGVVGDTGIVSCWPMSIGKIVKHMQTSDDVNSTSVLQVDTHGFLVTDEYDTHMFDTSPSTELRHSDLYHPLEQMGIQSTKKPASQSFEALMNSFSKWEFCESNYDADYENMALEYAEATSTMIELEHGKLEFFSDWDDVLNGHAPDEAPCLKKIEMKTSAGAPFCDQGVTKGDLIDSSHEWLKCKPEFRALLDKVEQRFLSGDVAGYPATANNKDELRDLERVAKKKTRLFCATPLHQNLLMRKYFGRWLGAYKRLNVRDSMQAMGMDVFGDDWDDLYDYLTTPGGIDPRTSNLRCLAGDFSRFDTSHSAHRLRGAISVAAAACADPDLVKSLGKSIEQFLVRFNGREVRVPAGLPSGCQLTTPLNCVLNILLWLTCWKKLTGTGLQQFKKNVRLVVYGDDVVVTMSKANAYFPKFSAKRIVEIMSDLGYTLEGDDGNDLEWKPMESVTFLKRRFVPDRKRIGHVHAQRPLGDIWTQLMWTRSKMTKEDRIAALQCFAVEIGQYEPRVQHEVWNILVEAHRKACKEQRDALNESNFKNMMRRAWEKEGELGDLVRLRQLFWKLW